MLSDAPPVRLPTLYTCEYEGERLSLFRDLDRTEEAMLVISPRDRAESLRFCGAVRALMRLLRLSREGGLFDAVRRTPTLASYFFLSAGDLAERFSHPLLRRFMIGLVGREISSLSLLITAAHFCAGNADLPSGGSRAAAERMAERFCSLGGELLLSSAAEEVLCRHGTAYGVRLEGGEVLFADAVLLAADPAALFGRVLSMPMPRSLTAMYHDPAFRRFSSVQCAFALPTAALPFRGNHVLFDGGEGDGRLVLREFTHESGFAPQEETVLTAMRFLCEAGACRYLKLAEDKSAYRAQKERLLIETEGHIVDHFPTLSGKLRPLDVWTPATYRRFTAAPLGAFMSFLLPKGRLPYHLPARVPGCKNIFFATQWQSPVGGLPTALASGCQAARLAGRVKVQKARSIPRKTTV